MKNEGVTILQIVITVVIMLIILSVTVFYGQSITKEAKISIVYNEIKEIESAIKEASIMGEITLGVDEITFFGEINIPKVDAASYSKVLSGDMSSDYYYLDFTSSKKLRNVLEIENVDNDYLLDLSDLNIFLIDGIDLQIDADKVETKYNSDEIVKYYDDIFVK